MDLALNVSEIIERITTTEIKYPEFSGASFQHLYRDASVSVELYELIQATGSVPEVDECAEYLLDRHYLDSLRYGSATEIEGILHRTRELVLNWFQALHLLALLIDKFTFCDYVTEAGQRYNVDFIIRLRPPFSFTGLEYIKETDIGLCTMMLSNQRWGTIGPDWLTRKINFKQIQGYSPWTDPVFTISNQHIPSLTINGLSLFGEAHIENLIEEIKVHFAPHQYTLLE